LCICVAGCAHTANTPSASINTTPLSIAFPAPAYPAIHGPRIVGTTPGKPFLFLIPATGEGTLTFEAENLPEGLALDPATGIISGTLKTEKETSVVLKVNASKGSATRKLTIVGGRNKLALTPPMGWNAWNVWARSTDAAKVRAAADWMVKSGLAAHGYQYINIDDTWEAKRDATGEIVPNEKFNDIKALADYVHSKGLKLGIYSSPGLKTCAGYEGSYLHEAQDANTYAKWGIDYLKYDWCGYGNDLVNLGFTAKDPSRRQRVYPYLLMGLALDRCGRDIVYSISQYGVDNGWEWCEIAGGNLWRTTVDIRDTWESMSAIGFSQDNLYPFAGPGHWNDPDMLVVGMLGWGKDIHASKLTPDEQLTHISLWSLLAAPLLIGCDLSHLDEFTLALLTNDEVIDIDQDPLGKQAQRFVQKGQTEVWARPLWDGTMAVGLFNRGQQAAMVNVNWSDLRLKDRQNVRDLWQHKDLGVFRNSFAAKVNSHGVVLIKVGIPSIKE
jgi:alpha-galactosidase